MYAIIDIETTGGKFNDEGITEIAIYKFDGEKIVDQFISLVTDILHEKYELEKPENQVETDPKKIMNKVIEDMKIECKNKELILTFPLWFTHGPYEKESVSQIIDIITKQTIDQMNENGMNCISHKIVI